MPTATDNGRVNGAPLYLALVGSAIHGTVGELTPSATTPSPVFLSTQGLATNLGFTTVSTSGHIPADVDSLYGVSTGSSILTYYRKRARDSSCLTVTYVYWTTTDPSTPYPGAMPCGGPLVDEVIVEVFQQ